MSLLMHASSLLVLDVREIEELEPWIGISIKEKLSNHVLIVTD